MTMLLLLLLSLASHDLALSQSRHRLPLNPFLARERRHTPFLPEDMWQGTARFGSTATNVSVLINDTARLVCPVHKVQDSAISFVRRRDFHILSNGHTLFTSDSRMRIVHRAKTVDWILVIHRARTQDQGTYECQVSLASGLYSLSFELRVRTPRARILNNADELVVDNGSSIELSCVINVPHNNHNSMSVQWYRGEQVVHVGLAEVEDAEDAENGRQVALLSRLLIRDALPMHSGNYTCVPMHATPASIQVFVSEDRLSEPLLRHGSKQSEKKFVTFGPNEASSTNLTKTLMMIFSLTICLLSIMH